ncbi:MAG: PAS domain-containing protein [Nannocystaceae bacterium]
MSDVDAITAERDALRAERDALREERDALAEALAQLQAALASSADLLDRSERLVHYLTDNAPAVIYVKDLEGRFLLSNRLHADLLGRTSQEILGRREGDLLSSDEAAQIASVTAAVLESGQTDVQEFRLHLSDGPRWFLEQIFPLLDGDGRPFAVAGISTDVTRRKHAEEEAAIFRALVERSPDAVVVGAYPIALGDPFVQVNEAARALLGDDDEIRGWLAGVIADVDDVFHGALERGEVWRAEVTHVRDDAITVFDASAFVIRSAADESAAWILRDVSEARRHTREREALQRQIIAAHEAAIEELSAPLMPLARGVVAAPLLGRYSRERSRKLMEVLTRGITRHQAKVVLLDLTGLRDVDAATALHLDRLIATSKLLGAKVILTGVPAAVARILEEVGFDQSRVTITRTMGDGLALALR